MPRKSQRSGAEPSYLTHERGLKSWLFTLDHKRIGVMYLAGILACFLLGGIIAIIIRLELFTPGKAFLSEDRYNELLHAARRDHDVPVSDSQHTGRAG